MEWLWRFDQSAQRAINQDWHSPALDTAFRFFTFFGLEQVFLPILLLLMLLPALRRTAWTAVLAWALAGLGAVVTKRLVDRLRPSHLPETIVAPDERIFYNSFPSGHATVAFAVAFAVAFTWPTPRRPFVAALVLSLACLVALSRVYRGVHWVTDVVAGACLGLLGALAAITITHREVSSQK